MAAAAVDSDFFSTITPVTLAAAVGSVLVAWIVARMARKAVGALAQRIDGLEPQQVRVAGRMVQYLILFLGAGIALTFLGAEVQPLIATVIIVAVIVALALRGIAENFASGIILQTRRPIRVGDEVDSLGFNGVVRDINTRSVVIETFDGRRVHLPNSEVLTNPLVNDTSHGARRSEIEVRIAGHEVGAVVESLQAATAAVAGVLENPSPVVHVTAISPGRVTTLVQFWHAPSNAREVVSDVIEHLAVSGLGEVAISSPIPAPPSTPPAAL